MSLQEIHLRLMSELPVRTVVREKKRPVVLTAREKRRRWYAKNKELAFAQMRRWRAKNREKLRLYWCEYRKRKREEREACGGPHK